MMTPALLLVWITIAPAFQAAAQTENADLERERGAILQAALDYAEGYYGGEPARMARAVSPYLSKRGLLGPPGAKPMLVQMNADTLIDVSNGAKLPPAQRRIDAAVLTVDGDIASARVFTAEFNDYLHLIRRNGTWQILNVLWHRPAAPASAADASKRAVEEAVREYARALFSADASRALAVLHPLAHLRVFAQAPGRARVVREQTPETLAATLAAGQIKPAGTLEEAQLVVDGVDSDIAAARLIVGSTPTYLHLARQDEQWRIVNMLTCPPPPPVGTAAR